MPWDESDWQTLDSISAQLAGIKDALMRIADVLEHWNELGLPPTEKDQD